MRKRTFSTAAASAEPASADTLSSLETSASHAVTLFSPSPSPSPSAELWYNKDGKKILVRRMIDDFCRQGMSDSVVLSTLVNEYMGVMNEYNITTEHLRGVRAKLDNDLPGVPGESRPAYRQAVVKAAGNLIVPWDRKVNPIGTSRVELSQLGIKTVPAEIFNFPLNSLFRILQLDNNLLTSFTKDFCRLTELTQLRLDRNRIDYVHESIGRMRSLRVLFLQHNKIVMLPWEIGLLTKLEALHIDHNKIEYMPITLGRLTNLKELKMGANPTCKAPPSHITAKSNRMQVDYIKRLDDGDTTGSINLSDLELTGFPTELLLPKLFHCLRVSHTTITVHSNRPPSTHSENRFPSHTHLFSSSQFPFPPPSPSSSLSLSLSLPFPLLLF